jgi:hypothetical protein
MMRQGDERPIAESEGRHYAARANRQPRLGFAVFFDRVQSATARSSHDVSFVEPCAHFPVTMSRSSRKRSISHGKANGLR